MYDEIKTGFNRDQALAVVFLALTPLIGGSLTFAGALGLGLSFLILSLTSLILGGALESGFSPKGRFFLIFSVNIVLVTLLDLFFQVYFPIQSQSWGIYFKLLAINPFMIYVSSLSSSPNISTPLKDGVKASGLIFLFVVVLGFFREVFGHGTFTALPGTPSLAIPGLSAEPVRFLATTGGAFVIVALILGAWNQYLITSRQVIDLTTGEVKDRRNQKLTQDRSREVLAKKNHATPTVTATPIEATTITPTIELPIETPIEIPQTQVPAEEPEPVQESAPPLEIETVSENQLPVESPVEAPEPVVEVQPEPQPEPEPAPIPEVLASVDPTPEPESSEPNLSEEPKDPVAQDTPEATTPLSREWGETWEGILEEIGKNKSFERKRILVIGCGTGEEVYYYGMKLLESRKLNPRLSFKIRGVDNFQARVETAVAGVYREHQVEFIPVELRRTYIMASKDETKHLIRMNNDLRVHLEFEVADYLSEAIFFHQSADMIFVNQSIDFFSDEKKRQFLKQVRGGLIKGGGLFFKFPLPRDLLPEGLKRTGEKIYRKK